MKGKRKSKGPFVAVPKAILNAPAWRAMSPEGRLLWIDLRGWLRNDGLNNGKVHRSCRDAAEALGLHKDTIARRFVENEHYGFLRKTAEGFLGSDGRGIAAKYASPTYSMAPTRQAGISRNGPASCSSIPPAEVIAKNRIPSYRVGHPVLPRRTYRQPPARVPYALSRRT